MLNIKPFSNIGDLYASIYFSSNQIGKKRYNCGWKRL